MLPKVVWQIMGREQIKRGVATVLCVLPTVEESLLLFPCHTHTTVATPLLFLQKKLPMVRQDEWDAFMGNKKTRLQPSEAMFKGYLAQKSKFECVSICLYFLSIFKTIILWDKARLKFQSIWKTIWLFFFENKSKILKAVIKIWKIQHG